MAISGTQKNHAVILPFYQATKQQIGPASRIVGLVRLKNFFNLIESENLQANPRDSRSSDITFDIQETLDEEPELFPCFRREF